MADSSSARPLGEAGKEKKEKWYYPPGGVWLFPFSLVVDHYFDNNLEGRTTSVKTIKIESQKEEDQY